VAICHFPSIPLKWALGGSPGLDRMRDNSARVAAAIFAAAAVPATIFAVSELVDRSRTFSGATLKYAFIAATNVWLIAFIIALLHAVILGLPAYFLARRFHLMFWWASIVFGFVIGFVPFAIAEWPMSHMHTGYRAWDGKDMVDYLIDGKPIMAGWIGYFYSAVGMGTLGMLSGFVAWLVWRFAPTCAGSKSAQSAS
jgi:hypothetical protein